MGCDMVVALPQATGSSQTLFGANLHRPPGEALHFRFVPGRTFALGETLQTYALRLPQVRETCGVFAVQPRDTWGYLLGVNERRVAIACSSWQSRIRRQVPGLLGSDLVRLSLERSHSARHALEVLTDLIDRHGQGSFPGNPEGDAGDHVFLLTDSAEAFAVEAAGHAWAAQEIHQVRAVSDVAVIRQDWCRLAPGLASQAIAEGWWTEDGSKLDFIQTMNENPVGTASALRRWGRATLLLENQNGHLDASWMRQLLADHYDGTRFEVDPLDGPAGLTPLCQHTVSGAGQGTAFSIVAQLPTEETTTPVLWAAFGPPCLSVHFPVLLAGNLPAAFSGEPADLWTRSRQLADFLATDPARWQQTREVLGRLQARFDQDLDDFLGEGANYQRRGEQTEYGRLASSLMQSHVERYEENIQTLIREPVPTPFATTAVSDSPDF